jgi:hypothetical protein
MSQWTWTISFHQAARAEFLALRASRRRKKTPRREIRLALQRAEEIA